MNVRITFKFQCGKPNYTASAKVDIHEKDKPFSRTEAIWTDFIAGASKTRVKSSVISKHVEVNASDKICVVVEPIECVLNYEEYNMLDVALRDLVINNTTTE